MPALPSRFDADMARRVRRFQSEKQLQVDGVVGSQTLIVLTQGLPATPNLEPRPCHCSLMPCARPTGNGAAASR